MKKKSANKTNIADNKIISVPAEPLITYSIQTVEGCFSAVERLGYRQWASNAEPTYITGTQMIFRIDRRTCTAGYSFAKKNYPLLSELQSLFPINKVDKLIGWQRSHVHPSVREYQCWSTCDSQRLSYS